MKLRDLWDLEPVETYTTASALSARVFMVSKGLKIAHAKVFIVQIILSLARNCQQLNCYSL